MFGNRVSFYQHNFLECQRNPKITPEWIFAIWYPDESSWSGQYHVASFRTEEQLQNFAKMLGFTYEWTEVRKDGYKGGRCSHVIENHSKDKEPCDTWEHYYQMAFHSDDYVERKIGNSWLDTHFKDECQAFSINLENLQKATRFKCHSNGSIVDGYFLNENNRIKIYRCNPNAKDFYHPLPLEEHIAFCKLNGDY